MTKQIIRTDNAPKSLAGYIQGGTDMKLNKVEAMPV